MVKYSVEAVKLPDIGAGSASGDYYQVRMLVEDMVEYIRLKDEVQESSTSEELTNLGLPTSFASRRSKSSRKRKFLETCNVPASAVESSSLARRIITSLGCSVKNWATRPFFLSPPDSSSDTAVVVARGVGPSGASFSLVQDTSTGDVREVPIERLREVPNEDLDRVFALTNSFVRAQLLKGKPAEVHEKYWDQRYRIFSRYDHGILLDPESWYSATYECIGEELAQICVRQAQVTGCKITTVWDGFSGCGGTGISFCRRGFYVTAIDTDGEKLRKFRHNATIYQAGEFVECIQQDIWQAMRPFVRRGQWHQILSAMRRKKLIAEDSIERFAFAPLSPVDEDETSNKRKFEKTVDLFVLCPPWGGPEYLSADTWDLHSGIPCGDGYLLTAMAYSTAKNIALVLPRNTQESQLRSLAAVCNSPCRVFEMNVRGKCKLIVACFGPLFSQTAL